MVALSYAVRTGLEPVTPCVTGMYSNQAELPHQDLFPLSFRFFRFRRCLFPDCECKVTTFFFSHQIFQQEFLKKFLGFSPTF